MKMFPVDIYKFIMWWRFYSNVCAVDSSDYIRKTGSRFKLCFKVDLFNCIVRIWYTCWDADNSVTLGWHGSAQSQSVGQFPLESPGCLNPSVHITCGTSSAWLLDVLHSNAGRSSVHSSRRIALKTADEPVVIMCQQILSVSEHTLSSNCTIYNVFQNR